MAQRIRSWHLIKPLAVKGYQVWAEKCLIFELRDEKNEIVSFYGRSFKETGETGKHFYTKNRCGLYPNYPHRETRTLILSESIIDAVSLEQALRPEKGLFILACYGTNGFTDEHQKAISKLTELEEIVFCFDGDEAGRKGILNVHQKLQALRDDLSYSYMELPYGEDANSILQAHEAEVFGELLKNRKAVPARFSSLEGDESFSREQKEKASPPVHQNTRAHPVNPENHAILSPLDTSDPDRLIYLTDELELTIWGGISMTQMNRLKLNLSIRHQASKYRSYRDDVNLMSDSQLSRYLRAAADALSLSQHELKHTLIDLREALECYRLDLREAQQRLLLPPQVQLTPEQTTAAEKLLKSPDLIQKTQTLIAQSGLVGEQNNGLLLFFLYLSRFFDEPLHAIIFGKSGSGKTYLQSRISELVPAEHLRTVTSLSENVLYYSPKDFWKHTVLVIEDLEGVYAAFLPLRELMSKQEIRKMITEKDPQGRMSHKILVVQGPVCVSGATTQSYIYEDNANRSFLLHLDESSSHKRAVMAYQRQLRAGKVNLQGQLSAKEALQHAQRLLKPVRVINPYATELRLPAQVFKKLRTNEHYLRLIEIITFYHQKQREWEKNADGEYVIETTISDIACANALIKDSLLRKSDELSGQVRDFFEGLKTYLKNRQQARPGFFAKEIREHFRLNPMRVNRHFKELEAHGLLLRTGGNRKHGFEYEVQSWDEYEILKNSIRILDETLAKLQNQQHKRAS